MDSISEDTVSGSILNKFKELSLSSPENEDEIEKTSTVHGKGDSFKFHASPACVALLSDVFDDGGREAIDIATKDEKRNSDGKIFEAEAAGDFKGMGKAEYQGDKAFAKSPIKAAEGVVSSKQETFTYKDFGPLAEEIAEVYGYYEMSSFPLNHKAFQEYLDKKQQKTWHNLSEYQKLDLIQTIVEDCESACEKKQFDAVYALTYLAQGCWEEYRNLPEQIQSIQNNVNMMLRCNAFWSVWMVYKFINSSTLVDLWNLGKKEQVLEGCFTIMATIMNVCLDASFSYPDLLEEFVDDLKEENLFCELMKFVVGVVEFNASCYLLKKIFIVLRCNLLLTLGDSTTLRKTKEAFRKNAGLKPSKEDTLLTCETIGLLQGNKWWKDGTQRKLMTLFELQEIAREEEDTKPDDPLRRKELPWSPKTSLEAFSEIYALSADYTERAQNFHGFFMMPKVINQKMDLLAQNLHIPLSQFQKEEEKLISNYPTLYANQEKILSEEADKIFAYVLSSLNEIVDSFRNVLAECVPRQCPRERNEFFIPMDADPTYFEEDRCRQPEVVVKAISSIMILLLNHFKLNHIYQFECLVEEMFKASYLPMLLRFFNRDLGPSIFVRQTYYDPGCLFKPLQVEYSLFYKEDNDDCFSKDFVPKEEDAQLLKRNLYAYTNLLRVLNKMVKHNPCRIRALSMLNPMGCLQRALNVKDPFFQQYLLKLCKALCRFMSQDWKKRNLQLITAIFHKVRHRILDGGWIGEMSLACKGRKQKPEQNATMWAWDFCEDEHHRAGCVLAYLSRRFGDIMATKSVNLQHQLKYREMKTSRADTPEASEKESEEWLSWEQ